MPPMGRVLVPVTRLSLCAASSLLPFLEILLLAARDGSSFLQLAAHGPAPSELP